MSRLGRLVLDVSPLRTSRQFRFAFLARLVSLLGIGLLVVAVPVQTYQLTSSSLHVAGVATTLAVAMAVGSLLGGVLADSFERRRTIQWARSAAGLAFLVLGLNALRENPSLAVVYGASVVDGLAGGVSSTALMAVVPGLVRPDQLAAAGALTTLTTDLGTVVMPAVAGVLIASAGTAPAYFSAAAATAATVTLVHGIGRQPPADRRHESPLRSIATGARFAVGAPVVRSLLLLGGLGMLVSGPLVLLPAYVEEVLGAGPSTLGLLYAAPAAGALLGSLTSGWTGRTHRPGPALLVALVFAAAGPAVLGLARHAPGVLPVAIGVLALAGHGCGRAVGDVLRFALLQRNTPDALRGRVSSLWMLQAVSGTAVGSAAAGLLAQWFAADSALLACGVAGLALTLLSLPLVRPLWRTPHHGRRAAVPLREEVPT